MSRIRSRIEAVYRKDVPDAPAVLFEMLEAQKQRLLALQDAKGPYVKPADL